VIYLVLAGHFWQGTPQVWLCAIFFTKQKFQNKIPGENFKLTSVINNTNFLPILFNISKIIQKWKTLKKLNTYSQINQAYDYSDANQNIKPVLIEREHVDKKFESEIGWKYGIMSDL